MRKGWGHRTVGVARRAVRLGVLGLWVAGLGHQHAIANPAPAVAEAPAVPSEPRGPSPTDRAVATWTEKVKRNPGDAAAWVSLGDALMQKARETADAIYYGRAEGVFQQALSLNPKSVGAMVGMAWVFGSRHEFEQSAQWARKALAADPANQDAYGLLGDAALEMGDYEAAFEHYQKMVDLRPNLASYSRGAHLLYLTGDVRKATWLMEKAIKAGAPYAENTAWARAQLALMLWGTGALVPAEQVLTRARAESPSNAHVLATLAKVKASQKDFPTAIVLYEKAIAIAPTSEAVIALGDVYQVTGQREQAEKRYALAETIFRLNKANGVQNDIERARFYLDHDRHLPEALREAEAVYPIRKTVFVADTLAWGYYKNGRYPDARKMIRQALRVKTPDAHILFHAGMIAAKVRDRPGAQRYLYRALSLNSRFHPLFAELAAETLKQMGGASPRAGTQPPAAAAVPTR